MDAQLLIICALTFVIHVIATLAYAVRIAGVRTRRIAVSFALFGIIALVSRTANSFQGPFLAKRVEEDLAHHIAQGMLSDFRLLLLAATIATVFGRGLAAAASSKNHTFPGTSPIPFIDARRRNGGGVSIPAGISVRVIGRPPPRRRG